MTFRSYPSTGTRDFPTTRAAGRKRAVCIGINRYSSRPLSCCVNDARGWEDFLRSEGFNTISLHDHQATKAAILGAIDEVINTSVPGDIVAIQYAGHGTQIRRTSGDEDRDEALVPIDFASGHYIVDDELASRNDRIPDGVSVTYFMDCCHSGNNTRSLFGVDETLAAGERVRFMPVDEFSELGFQRSQGPRSRASRNPYDDRKEVVFAACMDHQLSYESGNHGYFTARALRVARQGIQNLSNEEFMDRVRAEFRDVPKQQPQLWSDDGLWAKPFLGPRAAGGAVPAPINTGGFPGGTIPISVGQTNADRLKKLLGG